MSVELLKPNALAGGDWRRRFPPLLAVVISIALAVYALPSALNLPQANPGQVAEYAPVPGGDQGAQQGGNFAGLGLGGSAAGTGGLPPQPGGAGSIPKVPSTFDCVGNPPRQTADPLSPPCVASFTGDNGGATWVGVSRNEIRVIYHWVQVGGGGTNNPNCSGNTPPPGYYDMLKRSDYTQWCNFWYLHDWQTYFNRHYQTYGRFVHIYATDEYPADSSLATYNYVPEQDARNDWNQVHPFSASEQAGAIQYNEEMARHGTLSIVQAGAAEYQKFPGFMWGFQPNVDRVAQEYADFVCTKVARPGVTSFAGSYPTGTKRVYGFINDEDIDSNSDTSKQISAAALQYLRQDCGIVPKVTAQQEYCDETVVGGDPSRSEQSQVDMGNFQTAGVTTILEPACWEVDHPRAADQLRYYPEWMLGGDGASDGNAAASLEPPNEWQHAWIVTPETLQSANGEPVEPACWNALLEVDPTVPQAGSDPAVACYFYDDLRQLFTGIQVAGPHLTPQTMDVGFHAIPDHASTDPGQPACFYLTGDYTCVKDAVAEWWDTTARPQNANSSNANTGCWRMWAPPGRPSGFRFLPGQWPAGNLPPTQAGDICNLFTGNQATFVRNPPQAGG